MIRNEKGFSITELLITLVIFVVVIAASSQVFTALLTNFKQQSKIAETSTEGVIGLDILRRDLGHGGYGLPWALNDATYREAEAESGQTFWVDRELNDGPPDNPARGADLAGGSNAPAAFRTLNGDCSNPTNLNSTTTPGIHDSATNAKMPKTCADVLAIKATTAGMNEASQKWTYITNEGTWSTIKSWGTGGDGLVSGEFITVMAPIDGILRKSLKWTAGSSFYTTFGDTLANAPPVNSFSSYIIYGLGGSVTPRMPFNRADYYVKRPASGMPSRCAPHTGILYKAVLNQSDGKHTEYPILDCVVDFQVNFLLADDATCTATGLDWQPVAGGDKICNDISNMTAAELRGPVDQPSRLRDVRVYIVAQEGQKDANYDFSNNNTKEFVSTLEMSGNNSRSLNFVNLKNLFSSDAEPNAYKNYRWKLYTLIVKSGNLQ